MHVYGVYSRSREVWVAGGRSGQRVRKRRVRYDVRYRVDDRSFSVAFEQKGWANDFARRLNEDFAKGWLFDPAARAFVDPAASQADAPDPVTFYGHVCDYVSRKWPRWEPSTRRNAQRELALACLHLLRHDAPALQPRQRGDADSFLRSVALIVPRPQALTNDQQAWGQWFHRWSLPLEEVDDRHLHDFLEAVRTMSLDGRRRPLKATSMARLRATVRGAFSNARRRRLIDWDPWDAVEAEPLRDHDKVDPELVMDPAEVRRLAAACAAEAPRYYAFVLVQGICGLRPGEAVELRRRDVAVAGDRVVAVTVRATHATVPERFLVEGETHRRPLKGRSVKASRTIPVPTQLSGILRRHLQEYVGPKPDALVFTNTVGGRLGLSVFHRDVWRKAREAVFPEGDPLRRVHRQDLRHSAITTWLNAGVPLKTAQAWSGHKTVSVLLDTYLGVMKGDEAVALGRLESALGEEPDCSQAVRSPDGNARQQGEHSGND